MYVIWRRYPNIALKATTRLDRYVMMQNICLGVRLRTQAFLYAQENCIRYDVDVPRKFLFEYAENAGTWNFQTILQMKTSVAKKILSMTHLIDTLFRQNIRAFKSLSHARFSLGFRA